MFVKGGERGWVIPRAWGAPSRVGQSADLPGPGRMKGPNSPAGCRRQCRRDSPVCPAAQAWALPLRAQDHQEDVLSERVSLRDGHTQYPTMRVISSWVMVLLCSKLQFQNIHLVAEDQGTSQIPSLIAVYQTFSPGQEARR